MTYSPEIDDRDVAGFVPGPEVARPEFKFGVARLCEALEPKIGHSELNPEISRPCFGRVHPEPPKRVHIVAALALEEVAT